MWTTIRPIKGDMDAPMHRSGACGGLDVPRSSAFVVGTTDDSQDMMMDDIVEAGEHKSDCGVNTTITSDEIGEAMVCARCNMPGSDLRLLPCNCTFHAVSNKDTFEQDDFCEPILLTRRASTQCNDLIFLSF